MDPTQAHIQQQIKQAIQGEQTAYRFLLDTFWNTVYGFQLKRVSNEHDAEDITIETFAKAFDNITTYNTKYSFSTWLVSISKNIQVDKFRKKNASIQTQNNAQSNAQAARIIDQTPSPEDKLITEQNLAALLRHIKQLKPHYQEVIQLRYFKELTYNEISETLGIPLNNVKVRLLRARKLLAERITKPDTFS